MLYRRHFIKDLTLHAAGIFLILLIIITSTQAIKLLGHAANGQIAADAVAVLIGLWSLNMAPLLLVLTVYISLLSVLTAYWRNSEMPVYLASGISLTQWINPVLRFAVPFAVLVTVLQLSILPWAEQRAREFAELLRQKQEVSMVESGVFRSLGKKDGRVYFVEQFDAEAGTMHNLFVRERDEQGRENVVFAHDGKFTITNGQRTLELNRGYHYSGVPGNADFRRAAFEHMSIVINTTPKIVNPVESRKTIPTLQLFGSSQPEYRAELIWRLSMPIALLILSLLTIPLSYFNPRSGHTYNILFAIGFFLIYQNGQTLLRDAVSDGRLNFWLGLLPMHLIMLAAFMLLLRIRNQPARPFFQAATHVLQGGKE